jgi:microcompartment protein CcmL/EutN
VVVAVAARAVVVAVEGDRAAVSAAAAAGVKIAGFAGLLHSADHQTALRPTPSAARPIQ